MSKVLNIVNRQVKSSQVKCIINTTEFGDILNIVNRTLQRMQRKITVLRHHYQYSPSKISSRICIVTAALDLN